MRGKRMLASISVVIMLLLQGVTLVQADEQEKVLVVKPIEVTAKRTQDLIAQPLQEPASLKTSTTIIDEAEIEKQGAETVMDALEYVPGAWIETRGRKIKQFFSIRSQKYPYPEYAIDGAWQREFYDIPYLFSSVNIDRIEVIRSSAALLIGSSGLAGVVNIIPKKYRGLQTASEMEYGTFGTYRFNLSHGARTGDISYGISAGSYHTDGQKDKNSAEGISNFLSSVEWRPKKSLSIDANFFHIYGTRELKRAEPPAATRFQETTEKFDPIKTTSGNLKVHFQPEDRFSTQLLLHYIDRDHTFIADTDSSHKSTREWDYEWGGNLIQSLSLSRTNNLRLGGYYNHWIAPNGKRFFVGKRCDLETFSAVIVDEHRAGRLDLNAGLRWAKTYINDYGAFNINGSPKGFKKVDPLQDQWEPSILNGSLGATYYLSDQLSANLNFAAGSIKPTKGSLDISFKEPEDEARIKLDLGISGQQDSIGVASLTGFLVHQQNAIVLSGKTAEKNGRLMELYMNRDQDQMGIELDLHGARLFHVLEPFFNLTAMRSRAESDGEMTKNEEVPGLIMSGGVFVARSGLDFGILWKSISSYKSARFAADPHEPQPLGGYNVLTARIGYSLGSGHQARIYLKVDNLMDKRFSTVVGYPDSGRIFVLGLRQSFR